MEFKPQKKKQKLPDFLKDSPKDSSNDPLNLYNDPEWRDLREEIKKRSQEDIKKNSRPSFLNRRPIKPGKNEKNTGNDQDRVEVNIKLSVPKVDWVKLQNLKKRAVGLKSKIPPKIHKNPKAYLALCLIIAVVGVLLLVGHFAGKDSNKTSNNSGSGQQTSSEPISHDPPFGPVLPSKGINKEKIAYNPERNFAKFDDRINGVAINVSQQPLPENLKKDPESGVEQLAESLGAKQPLQIAGGGIAYISESISGPQIVVLKKFNLLIFIKTGNRVEVDAIVDYINSLN